jgi:TRAP-type mannitol/chloroaromatic compound transport system permease small subunit
VNKPGNVILRGFSAWVSGLNGIGTILIFFMMLLINLDVLSRYLFNAPVEGVTELVELSIVCIVFLQISDAIRAGRLTRSDGLYSRITSHAPAAGHLLGIIFDLTGALFFLAILYGSLPRLIEAWRGGYYAGNVGIFTFPVWPIRLILVVGCVTAIVVFVQFICRHIAAMKGLGKEV